MEKKEEGKKIDPKSSWMQVTKSSQMKATSTSAATSATSTSGSSFTGTAAGGAWASSGAAGGEHRDLLGLLVGKHGDLLGLLVGDHGDLLRPISGPLALCRLSGLHGLSKGLCNKDRERRHGSLPEPMNGPLVPYRMISLHGRHPNPNRHPTSTWNLHRRQKCDKHRHFHRCGHRPQLVKSPKKMNK